jgi:hypothetical protein
MHKDKMLLLASSLVVLVSAPSFAGNDCIGCVRDRTNMAYEVTPETQFVMVRPSLVRKQISSLSAIKPGNDPDAHFVFVDIDRTLLHRGNRVNKGVVAEIKRLQRAGVKVIGITSDYPYRAQSDYDNLQRQGLTFEDSAWDLGFFVLGKFYYKGILFSPPVVPVEFPTDIKPFKCFRNTPSSMIETIDQYFALARSYGVPPSQITFVADRYGYSFGIEDMKLCGVPITFYLYKP